MDFNKPLVTVIVPVYKVEKYLRKCVDSILLQTYENIEIILVDDGSPDNCGAICDEYAQKDSRIKVIHKENGGLSDARNAAIDVCTGEYLTFIDSDDYVASDYVEVLYNLVEKYNCKLSIAIWQTFYETDAPVVIKNRYYEACWKPGEAVSYMFYQEKFDNAACVKLYHRSLFDAIRFPKGMLFEDLYITYRLLFNSDMVAYCNKKIYYYLLRRDSIEGSAFSSLKVDSAMQIFKTMEEENYDLIKLVEKAYKCRVISFSFHLLLKAPDDYENIDILYKRIKKYRWDVLCDWNARKKARIACFLSYFGLNSMRKFFKMVDKRKDAK